MDAILKLADQLPFVMADHVQLQQVILNLLVNAVEAISGVEKGDRKLVVRADNDEPVNVAVEVSRSSP